MKKTKMVILTFLGLLFLLPFIKISIAQPSYVAIEAEEEYQWELNVYGANWGQYFSDNLEETLGNLFPLGPEYNLTLIYNQWSSLLPPQSYWNLTVTDIGAEETGALLSPFDNTTITHTPVNGTFGWQLISIPAIYDYWDMSWSIVNDTSSFLRQTLNLTMAFSTYAIWGVIFAPTPINWTSFVTKFLGVMSSRGGFYDNITATAQTNGYALHVPALGFENNSAAIDINVTYNSNGVLTYYEFSYGGAMLTTYKLSGFTPQAAPIITNAPTDFTVESGYTGVNISWTATDLSPNTYTIELQGTGVVAGPTTWSSGVAITYNVPDGLAVGDHIYTVNFTDLVGNSITDTVIMTVEAAAEEEIIPGYEPLIVIGITAIASIGLIVIIKKKYK